MRKIILIFSLVPFIINAQLITGTLIDTENSKSIPFAAIGMNGTSTGTVSNQNGEFSFETNGIDSIVISHLNYGLNLFKVKLNGGNQVFKLKPVTFSLDEIVVTGKTVPEILNEAISKSEQQISSPIFLKSYYREFVKTNENYTKFSDGIVNYSIEKKGKGKLKTKVWVTDSRAVELFDEKEEEIDWDLTSPLDIQDGLNVSMASNIGKFMLEEEQSKYEFEINSANVSKYSKWGVISISPKKEIEEMLFEGTVAIDYESGLIMQVEYQLSEYHKKFSKEINLLIIKAKLLESKTKVLFNKSETNYNIAYILKDRSMKIWNKKSVDDEFRFTSDLLATEILTDPNSLKKEDLYSKKSLYKRKNLTKSKFWINSNAIKLTPEQQQIIESLKGNNVPKKQ